MLLREVDQFFRNELLIHDLSASVIRCDAMHSAPFGVI